MSTWHWNEAGQLSFIRGCLMSNLKNNCLGRFLYFTLPQKEMALVASFSVYSFWVHILNSANKLYKILISSHFRSHYDNSNWISFSRRSVYNGSNHLKKSSDKELQKETTRVNDFIKSRSMQSQEALLGFGVVCFQSKFSSGFSSRIPQEML